MVSVIPILPLNTSRIQPLLPMTLLPSCWEGAIFSHLDYHDGLPAALLPSPNTLFQHSSQHDAFKKDIGPLLNTLQ